MIMLKIAIAGKMGSGKSTVAESIKVKYPDLNIRVLSFADRVKALCVELFGMDHKDRCLLVNFAMKMREIDENVWIRSLLARYCNQENIVIDDLRFMNEFESLRARGFKLIKLEIDEVVRLRRLNEKYGDDTYNHLKYSNSVSENCVNSLSDDCFDLVVRTDDLTQLWHFLSESL